VAFDAPAEEANEGADATTENDVVAEDVAPEDTASDNNSTEQ
jgi:hypothetical protein